MKYNFKIYYSHCTKCKYFRNCYEVDDEYSNHFPNYISEECSIEEENAKLNKKLNLIRQAIS